MSCLLKHFIRKIKIKVNRRFDVPNIILKIEVVYANVNDLNLENDVWYIETSINLYFNFSYTVIVGHFIFFNKNNTEEIH